MASLQGEVERFVAETTILQELLSEIATLQPAHRKLIAELIIVKLAVGFENCISQGLYKLAAGQPDLGGNVASRHITPSTISSAKVAILAGSKNAPWLNASDVCLCLKKVVDSGDPLLTRIRRHGATITNIRKIRNHVAHKNRNSSVKFRDVVRQVYGAPLNNITPGTLLLTKRAGPRSLCASLIIGSRVAISEIFQRS